MRAGEPVSSDGNSIAAGVAHATAARFVVEPVDAKQVQRMGRIGIDCAEALRRSPAGSSRGPSIRRRSAGRPRRRGSGPAFACRRRRRPDAFPVRAAPFHFPFPVSTSGWPKIPSGDGRTPTAPRGRAGRRHRSRALPNAVPCGDADNSAGPEGRKLASVACAGRTRSWSDRTPVSSKLIRRVKSTRRRESRRSIDARDMKACGVWPPGRSSI